MFCFSRRLQCRRAGCLFPRLSCLGACIVLSSSMKPTQNTCKCFHGAPRLVISLPWCSDNEVLFFFAEIGGFGPFDAGVRRGLFANWNGDVARTACWRGENCVKEDAQTNTWGHLAVLFSRKNIFELKILLIHSREASANLICLNVLLPSYPS